MRRWTIAFWAALALGFAIRVALMWTTEYRATSDTSVVYLMALGVREGHFPAFYWGQSYGGTLLSLVAGAVMLVTGPSIVVLSVVSLLIWALAALLLRRFAADAFGPRTGDLAGILFWFPGAAVVHESLLDPGFYGPSLALGIGALAVVFATRGGRRRWWQWGMAGMLAGLAVWQSPVGAAFAAPAAVYALIEAIVDAVTARRRWFLVPIGVATGIAGAVLGALPWILETLKSGAATVHGNAVNVSDNLVQVFSRVLPAAFPGSGLDAVRVGIGTVAILLVLALLVLGIVRRSGGAIVMGAAGVLLAVIIAVYAAPPLDENSVRYASFFIPVLATAIAWLVSRWTWLSVAAGAASLAMTTAAIATEDGFAVSGVRPYDAGIVAAADWLESQGIDHAYGTYWTAYLLTAATDERVTVASVSPDRYPPYSVAAVGLAPMAVVVVRGTWSEYLLTQNAPEQPSESEAFGLYEVYVFPKWFDPATIPFTSYWEPPPYT